MRPDNQQELNESIYAMAQEQMDKIDDVLTAITYPQDPQEREELDIYREPLSIDVTREVNIMLSWGGPSDGFKLYFEKDESEPFKGVYWFADWGTYAEQPLTDEQTQEVFDLYLYGDASSFFDV